MNLEGAGNSMEARGAGGTRRKAEAGGRQGPDPAAMWVTRRRRTGLSFGSSEILGGQGCPVHIPRESCSIASFRGVG